MLLRFYLCSDMNHKCIIRSQKLITTCEIIKLTSSKIWKAFSSICMRRTKTIRTKGRKLFVWREIFPSLEKHFRSFVTSLLFEIIVLHQLSSLHYLFGLLNSIPLLNHFIKYNGCNTPRMIFTKFQNRKCSWS